MLLDGLPLPFQAILDPKIPDGLLTGVVIDQSPARFNISKAIIKGEKSKMIQRVLHIPAENKITGWGPGQEPLATTYGRASPIGDDRRGAEEIAVARQGRAAGGEAPGLVR